MNRFKKYIGKLITIALAVVVLLSTSGFKIYSHHCSTSHTHNYSIIVPADECGHEKEAEIHKSCCSVPETPKTEDNCCKNTEEIVQLKTNTVLNHTTPELKISEFNLVLNYLVLDYLSLTANKTFTNNDLIQESPPPHLVPEYLSLIQVYII